MKINLKRLTSVAKRCSNRVFCFLKKHDTEILVTVGVAGTIGGTVMVCKATDKAKDIVNDLKNARDKIETLEITDEEKRAQVVDIYRTTCVELAKVYTPSVLTLSASVASIFVSHHMNVKRLASVTAAYATLDEMFKNYRGNVIDKYGKDEDFKLMYGITEEEIEEATIDKNGKETKKKKKVLVSKDGSKYSGYSRIFDELCPSFRKNDWEHNKFFLEMMEKAFNERLNAIGHVWLNEVYEALGFEKTIAGQSVGWLKNNPNGDGFISFGIHDIYKKGSVEFMKGLENAVILDFNVDGVILGLEGLGYATI